ncbi:hypothetical protein FGU46_05065 [Methanobacterium sp. CWC-01]|uniref:hypothetical protein n=1 Tax=Methanobacterium aridiramus TaxID=2584467 RepID=UPI002575B004|nr:hypothetical protein [Methanobacterium sp. CWC-01]WJI09506.1 hypothetical protein FGU46_05065 [Methanobacterium sp. CWC-01]
MPGFNSYLFWEEDYRSCESEFLEFLTYVPLSDDHYNVWSLKLANQLLLIGSSIDSFFKSALYSLRKKWIYNHIESNKYYSIGLDLGEGFRWFCYNGIGYIEEDFKDESDFYCKLLKDAQPNMGLYREMFEDYYHLSSKSVYVLRTEEELRPFQEWEDGRSPEWWKIYTDLKHSKFQNKKNATLKTVLDSLSALFLLNVYHIDNRKFLANHGILRGNINLNHPEFLNSREKIDTLEPIIAKTDLFGYVWDTNGHWTEYPWSILNPGNVYGL